MSLEAVTIMPAATPVMMVARPIEPEAASVGIVPVAIAPVADTTELVLPTVTDIPELLMLPVFTRKGRLLITLFPMLISPMWMGRSPTPGRPLPGRSPTPGQSPSRGRSPDSRKI